MDAITQGLWERWRAVGFISLGVVFSLCLPIFLTVAGFVLLFISIPVFLFWTSVRLTILFLHAFFRALASKLTTASPLRTQNISHSRKTSRRSLISGRTATSRSVLLTDAIDQGTPRSKPDVEGSKCTHSALKNIRNDATTTSIVTSGVRENTFVESPLEYTSEDVLRYTRSPLETLSMEILEEIVGHLPNSSISSLALVSKKFGTQFRFRNVHSGTERFSIRKFSLIAKEPQLGMHTTHMIVHRTFYLPHVKVQWLLDGSEPEVSQVSRYATEGKKLQLISTVLEACPRIRSLIWNEGVLTLHPTILETLQIRLTTSLRHLDISVDSQFLHYFHNPTLPSLDTIRLSSLTLRGGFSAVSARAVTTLFSLTATSIRYVRLIDTSFPDQELAASVFAIFLGKSSGLRRLDIINPSSFDITSIPLGQTGEGFEFFVDSVSNFLHTPHSLKENVVLSNLSSLVLSRCANPWDLSGLTGIISIAINLRVLSSSCPIPPSTIGQVILLPADLLDVLIKRITLISLSLSCWTISHNQIKVICEALPNVSHLCVLMDGNALQISRYSQHFSKLKNLVALDVILNPMYNGSCVCGHEDDPRALHIYEGSAMGRLCRRFIRKPPTEFMVVRLSENGWPPEDCIQKAISDVKWIGLRDMAIRKLETICGACENEEVTIQKIFNATSWMTIR